MSTKVKIDSDNTGNEEIEMPITKSWAFLVFNLCPNGEKITVQMVQIGPKRVSRTFAQESKNEIDNF